MGSVDRRQELLDNISRLRRVERELSPNRDLVAVRMALESELGETVSLRMAARVLGVSHTALRRWVDAGELPVVFDSRGRQGVPVEALLELRESMEAGRHAGRSGRHALEAAMSERRDRAERLDVHDLVDLKPVRLEGHGRAELRSLAYHRALARRLRRPMIEDALRLIWKWRAQGSISPRYADRWEEILALSVADVRRAIGEDGATAAALRQTSPFAGMLSEAERRKILQEIH